MDLNTIKKYLYKQKPEAIFYMANIDGLHYDCIIVDTVLDDTFHKIKFLIPFADIGEAKFMTNQPAQLLIRYIV